MSSPEKRKQTAMVGESTSHNPSFVTKVPWYLGKGASEKEETLDHQKNWKPAASSSLAASTPEQAPHSTVSRPSDTVCDNCGNKGHVRKDCLERPRKVLAKFSEEQVAPVNDSIDNVVVQSAASGFEAKRDRWEGFEANDYSGIVDEYSRQEIRRKLQADGADDARRKKFEADDTVANLRVRNDTAKYLYNLDVNSAFYDPKSRSMRDDPRASTNSSEYKGDNFVRYSGDAAESMKVRQFAWESAQRGEFKVHEIANPTESVLILKKKESQAKEKISEQQRAILEKYGALEQSSDSD